MWKAPMNKYYILLVKPKAETLLLVLLKVTPPRVFFTFFKLYKCYQITQNITNVYNTCEQLLLKKYGDLIQEVVSKRVFVELNVFKKCFLWSPCCIQAEWLFVIVFFSVRRTKQLRTKSSFQPVRLFVSLLNPFVPRL